MRMGLVDEGITYLMEADTLKSNDARIKSDLGYAYVLKGEFELAEESLRESLDIDPSNAQAINNLAMAVGYQGRVSESFAIYRSVVGAAEAHSNLGYICSQLGRTDLAISQYNKALSIDPTLRPAAEALVQIADLEAQVIAHKSGKDKREIQLTGGRSE